MHNVSYIMYYLISNVHYSQGTILLCSMHLNLVLYISYLRFWTNNYNPRANAQYKCVSFELMTLKLKLELMN